MGKSKRITKTMQKVAADILQYFEFTNSMEEVYKAFDDVKEKYGLMSDPFTHTVCTPDEWYDNKLEYDKQTMIERFGHCDGLE